ncbi:MAG: hypothetical protein WCK05_15980, partial [Planctomycetota bacterium]
MSDSSADTANATTESAQAIAPLPSDVSVVAEGTSTPDVNPPVASSDTEKSDADVPKAKLLDVIRSVVSKAPQKEASSAIQEPVKVLAAQPETPQDDAKLPFAHHPRFKELLNQNRDLRSSKVTKEEFEVHRADANSYRKVTGFMDTYGLKIEDVAEGFNIMALMKTDPAAALKRLQSHYNQLQKVTGNVLPDDLREKVESGFTDEETARELARRRAIDERTQELARQHLADTERQHAEAIKAEHRTKTLSVVADWERGIRSRDPDYDRKSETMELCAAR